MDECIFCKIIRAEEPAEIIFEDENNLAIYPMAVEVNDHILVLPKTHYENIYDIPHQALSNLMHFTKELTSTLKQKYGYPAVNILHASGIEAQQSVMHFHFHIMPRVSGDGVHAWPDLPGGVKSIGIKNGDQ